VKVNSGELKKPITWSFGKPWATNCPAKADHGAATAAKGWAGRFSDVVGVDASGLSRVSTGGVFRYAQLTEKKIQKNMATNIKNGLDIKIPSDTGD
jgi:hypothetical protein